MKNNFLVQNYILIKIINGKMKESLKCFAVAEEEEKFFIGVFHYKNIKYLF